MDLDLCIYNLHLKDLLHLDTALRQEKHMVGGEVSLSLSPVRNGETRLAECSESQTPSRNGHG